MGVGGQRHAPAAIPPGKTRYPLFRSLGGPQGRSGQVRKISPPTGIRSLVRPSRSESVYRLSYREPYIQELQLKVTFRLCCRTITQLWFLIFPSHDWSFVSVFIIIVIHILDVFISTSRTRSFSSEVKHFVRNTYVRNPFPYIFCSGTCLTRF